MGFFLDYYNFLVSSYLVIFLIIALFGDILFNRKGHKEIAKLAKKICDNL